MRIGIIYSSVHLPLALGQSILRSAVQKLLGVVDEEPRPDVLWSLQYSQPKSSVEDYVQSPIEAKSVVPSEVLLLSEPSTDLVFDDRILERVRISWQKVTGESEGFMHFEDREIGAYDDDDP